MPANKIVEYIDIREYTYSCHIRSQDPLFAISIGDLSFPETAHGVVVEHPGRLHMRVADLRPEELKAAFLEVRAQRVRLLRRRGIVGEFSDGVDLWLSADKTPDIFRETSEFRLDLLESLRVVHGRFDLHPVPDDARILKQLFDLRLAEPGDLFRLEIREGLPVIVPLPQNRVPAEARLRGFQGQKFEYQPVVMNGDSPLPVVILHVVELAKVHPGAAVDFDFGFWFHAPPSFPRGIIPGILIVAGRRSNCR